MRRWTGNETKPFYLPTPESVGQSVLQQTLAHPCPMLRYSQTGILLQP